MKTSIYELPENGNIFSAPEYGIVLLSKSLTIKLICSVTENLWQCSSSDLAGRSFNKSFPDAVYSAFYRMLMSARENKLTCQETVVCPVTWKNILKISVSFYYNDITIKIEKTEEDKELARSQMQQDFEHDRFITFEDINTVFLYGRKDVVVNFKNRWGIYLYKHDKPPFVYVFKNC
jgi:hypothetical protein